MKWNEIVEQNNKPEYELLKREMNLYSILRKTQDEALKKSIAKELLEVCDEIIKNGNAAGGIYRDKDLCLQILKK